MLSPRPSRSSRRLPTLALVLGAPLSVAARVRSCTSSCLDLCEIGATILQEPEHVAYGHVTIDDVDAIADAAGRGDVVERLVVRPTKAEV